MKKMPCLFQRDFSDPRRPVLLDAVTPGCGWVFEGLGSPSAKLDGTACAVIDGKLYARYDAKRDHRTGQLKLPPLGAIPCTDGPDEVTGHWPHWLEVTDQPQYGWHKKAWQACCYPRSPPDGTYELVGPHFQANPHGYERDTFVRHGSILVSLLPNQCTFEGLRELLSTFSYEGIVFWDEATGRRCKIRRADYGFSWPVPS